MTWDQLVAFFSWMPKHHTFYTDYWNGVRDEPKEDTGNPSLVLDGDVKRSEFEEWRKTQSPTWTTAKPTKDGWYWFRSKAEGPIVVRIYGSWVPTDNYKLNVWVGGLPDETDCNIESMEDGEWYGPLEIPS